MTSEPPTKRPRLSKPRKIRRKPPPKPGSADATILFSIERLLGKEKVEQLTADGLDYDAPHERFAEVEVGIKALSTHGDGLGLCDSADWIVVVPFSLPGERVLARVHRHERLHSHADLIRRLKDAPEGERIRDDSLVRCQYFGRCSGCQYQQLPYNKQLEIKQSVVERAFAHSDLPSSAVPPIQATLPSPLQYGYRTKLTPHFNPPSGKEGEPALAIGFEEKGRKRVMDIETCPIATHQINDGLTRERKRVQDSIATFKRGATVLLRHAWPAGDGMAADAYCETDHKKVVRERVGSTVFEFTAGSFFQNNNSILPDLVGYIGDQLDSLQPADDQHRFLVDAYCGSGLFSISLATRFQSVRGIEISSESVKAARRNAELNNVANATFVGGKAEAIFASIDFAAEQTTVIIDPPRKGCDELFLSQLVAYGPSIIVYVSCSVHTQAPDIVHLVKGGYEIRSIRGVDLFPQTHHVESVAVLTRTSSRV